MRAAWRGGRRFEEDWVRVRGDWEGKGKVVGLGCGVWCSWIVVDTRVAITRTEHSS